MSIGIETARPPYIEFEQRAIEDREATIKNDRITYKDVDFVIVRQIGSVNTVEKIASEWLRDQRILSDKGKLPPDWVAHFEKRYDEWKEGLEPSVNGSSLRLWPAISKADVENCARLKIFTVEDLAQINDDTMQKMGMGARALQQKAQAWLDADGKGGEELAALRAKTEDQATTIESLLQKVEELEAALPKKKGKAA